MLKLNKLEHQFKYIEFVKKDTLCTNFKLLPTEPEMTEMYGHDTSDREDDKTSHQAAVPEDPVPEDPVPENRPAKSRVAW